MPSQADDAGAAWLDDFDVSPLAQAHFFESVHLVAGADNLADTAGLARGQEVERQQLVGLGVGQIVALGHGGGCSWIRFGF